MRGFLVLLTVLFLSASTFAASIVKEERILTYGDVEYVIRNTPENPKTTQVAKYSQGRLIYDVAYTVDDQGFRVGPHSRQKGKTKHFLIIDGSVAFGEGLDDDETIHDLINARSKVYEAYSIGLPGEGPQHHWQRFKKGALKKHITQKFGTAFIITSDADIAKFTGNLMTLPFTYNFPRLIEEKSGVFVNTGTFEESGSLFQHFLSKMCFPYIFCTNLINKLQSEVNSDEIVAGARLFNSISKMYKQDYYVEDVIVLWTGTQQGGLVFKAHTDLRMAYFLYDTHVDGHPNKKGAQEIVRELFRLKMIY